MTAVIIVCPFCPSRLLHHMKGLCHNNKQPWNINKTLFHVVCYSKWRGYKVGSAVLVQNSSHELSYFIQNQIVGHWPNGCEQKVSEEAGREGRFAAIQSWPWSQNMSYFLHYSKKLKFTLLTNKFCKEYCFTSLNRGRCRTVRYTERNTLLETFIPSILVLTEKKNTLSDH